MIEIAIDSIRDSRLIKNPEHRKRTIYMSEREMSQRISGTRRLRLVYYADLVLAHFQI